MTSLENDVNGINENVEKRSIINICKKISAFMRIILKIKSI